MSLFVRACKGTDVVFRDRQNGTFAHGVTMHRTIFGLRFQSSKAILPGAHELSAFLESPRKEGRPERHGDDLAMYVRTLEAVAAFEQDRRQGTARYDFQEKMLYGVLAHSQFFRPELKSAVEQYKYHYHALAALDLRKPAAFIRSAEEEISRLNPKKKDETAKTARLQVMVDERKQDLDALKARWLALAGELSSIADYVRDNLSAVQELCEASIAALVDLQVGRKEEVHLIEDLKAHFKDQVRDSLQHGPVTKEYIETLKETVARLSKQISLLLLEDIYSLSGLYEAVHEHAGRTVRELGELATQVAKRKHASLDEDKDLYGRVEQALVSLVSGFRFELKARETTLREPEHEKILYEKRKEMLDHLFGLLQKETR